MDDIGIGNIINRLVCGARGQLFDQGEFAQLTFGAFNLAAKSMDESGDEKFEVTFPVGYLSNRTTIPSTRTYKKEELLGRYQYLAFHRLSLNGLFQLVTIIQSLLGDVIRYVVVRYPQKLGAKRQIKVQHVLESKSIEEVHYRAMGELLNELAFKSPADFACEFERLVSVRLLECPAFERYAEIKATRDIYMHNSGIANDVYVRKADSHARALEGAQLPVDVQYFLESYECCLQIVDWLETALHDKWHSSEHESRKNTQQLPLQGGGVRTPPSA